MEKIKFSYKGKDYSLTYTSATICKLERLGFSPDQMEANPFNTLYLLFYGAFLAEQPNISRDLSDEIYDALGDHKGLIEKLKEMYMHTAEVMVGDDPEGVDEKKVKWTLEV